MSTLCPILRALGMEAKCKAASRSCRRREPLLSPCGSAPRPAGGRAYLAAQAHENPVAFLALIGKVLPTTLASDPNDPLVIEIVHITVDASRPPARLRALEEAAAIA
jgi:hypothetical protein